MKDVGSEVKTYMAIKPQVASGQATAINGYTINRRGCESGVFSVQVGDATGAPSEVGVTFKMQHQSGQEGWTDVSGVTYTFSGQVTAGIMGTGSLLSGQIAVDFRNCAEYVRLVATPSFANGSSPKIQIAAVCVVGQAGVVPIK